MTNSFFLHVIFFHEKMFFWWQTKSVFPWNVTWFLKNVTHSIGQIIVWLCLHLFVYFPKHLALHFFRKKIKGRRKKQSQKIVWRIEQGRLDASALCKLQHPSRFKSTSYSPQIVSWFYTSNFSTLLHLYPKLIAFLYLIWTNQFRIEVL